MTLPTYQKTNLPTPILEGEQDWCDMYDKAWEIASGNIHEPSDDCTFVSGWLDAGYSKHIFQWDTIFMMMFARYGHRAFSAIQSLDNFYALQEESGYICREYKRDGDKVTYKQPSDSVNPPLFSWAEVEYAKLSQDTTRFSTVTEKLKKYAQWLDTAGSLIAPETGRKCSNGKTFDPLYWNTNLGSGMDNSPRDATYWVDMSSQMVIMYRNLAVMCSKSEDAQVFSKRADMIAEKVNQLCWDQVDCFYYDQRDNPFPPPGNLTKQSVRTVAGFWPLLAGIPTTSQAQSIVDKYLDQGKEFWTQTVYPSLSPGSDDFMGNGLYWRGGVWAPTNYMIIKGLEQYGYEDLATNAAKNYLTSMATVFKETGQIWETYQPMKAAPGVDTGGQQCRDKFVGWSGLGPIALLIENIIGIRIDSNFDKAGSSPGLTWKLNRTDKHGIKSLAIGEATVDLTCNARSSSAEGGTVEATSDKPITISIENRPGGKPQSFDLDGGRAPVELTFK